MGTERELRPVFTKTNRQGYVEVRFSGAVYKVHRLVLETFVGPCPQGMECRHLDGDKTNNRVENLRWGTKTENWNDKVRHGRDTAVRMSGESNGSVKLTDQEVLRMIRLRKSGRSIKSLSREFGVCRTHVKRLTEGKARTYLTEKV